MRTIHIIVFLLIFSFCNGQSTDKLSPLLKYKVEKQSDDAAEMQVWIFFKDKGGNISGKLADAESMLTKRAKERRSKNLRRNNITDFYDVAVNPTYINEVTPFLSKKRHVSNWLNAISANVAISQIENIIALEYVDRVDVIRNLKSSKIEKNNNLESITGVDSTYNLDYGPSLVQNEQMNVPLVHDMGFTGDGVLICMMDAGFARIDSLDAFENIDIVGTYDFINDDPNVDDQVDDLGLGFHGRATLSTIGGFHEGQLIGPAYGASYLLAKTENTESETMAEEDAWVAAAEWAELQGVDITSTSLGYVDFDNGFEYTPEMLDGNTAIITIAADILASKGVLVVNSAGNSGNGVTTINAPSDGDMVLAIGAVDDEGVKAGFSSVGPTGDGRIKPDVMAMGRRTIVANADNTYGPSNGTSFSCPLAAGAAALLMEMLPNATSFEIFDAIKATADNANNPNNDYGWGIINILAAYEYLLENDTEPPTAVCQDIVVALDSNGMASIAPMMIDAGSHDDISLDSMYLDLSTFDCNNIGTQEVTLTVVDQNGNINSCASSVSVEDKIAPTPDLTILETIMSECSIPSIDAPTATDECAGAINGVGDLVFPIEELGTYTINWSFVDNSGNVSQIMQIVEVVDNSPPMTVCDNITIDMEGMDTVYITPQDIDNGSSDNCNLIETAIDISFFTEPGVYDVSLTATDGAGLSSSCTSEVTVINSVVGLEDEELVNITLYPNPSQSMITLDAGNYISKMDLKFYTMNGRLIKSHNHYTTGQPIDVSDFAPGTYMIRAVGMDQTFTFEKM